MNIIEYKYDGCSGEIVVPEEIFEILDDLIRLRAEVYKDLVKCKAKFCRKFKEFFSKYEYEELSPNEYISVLILGWREGQLCGDERLRDSFKQRLKTVCKFLWEEDFFWDAREDDWEEYKRIRGLLKDMIEYRYGRKPMPLLRERIKTINEL